MKEGRRFLPTMPKKTKQTIAATYGQEAVYDARLALVTRIMQMPASWKVRLSAALAVAETRQLSINDQTIILIDHLMHGEKEARRRTGTTMFDGLEFMGIKKVQPAPLTDAQTRIAATCDRTKAMLLEKNRAYGNSALDPVRIFSKADPVEQLLVRIDDKLSRIVRGDAAGEDVLDDLIGYFVLLKVARELPSDRSEGSGGNPTVPACGLPGPDDVTCALPKGHADGKSCTQVSHLGGGWSWNYVNPARKVPLPKTRRGRRC
jgi:hypothetical protein